MTQDYLQYLAEREQRKKELENTTAVITKCKDCGVELPTVWYYYSWKFEDDMNVLDGPLCLNCLIRLSTKQRGDEK